MANYLEKQEGGEDVSLHITEVEVFLDPALEDSIGAISSQKDELLEEPFTMETFKEIIAEQLGITEEEIQPKSLFHEDLGAGSFDIVDLIVACEDEWDFTIDNFEPEKFKTVQDLFDYLNTEIGGSDEDFEV